MHNLKRYGNWALITGAASGLGREFAREIAADGMNCVLVDIDAPGLETLAKELRETCAIEARPIVADLAQDEFVDELSAKVVDLEIGLLINNAGIACSGAFSSRDPKRISNLVKLNCLAPLLLTRSLLPAMLSRKRGAIVFVSSLQAFISSPYEAAYCASKAFSLHFGESLWGELRKQPVDCLTVCPAGMKTDFFRAQGFSDKECEQLWKYSSHPAEIAKLALRKLGKKPVIAPKMTMAVHFLSRFLPRQLITRGSEKLTRKLVRYERA
ncbi:MAG: SDR family NAD(P)-dependent oxidoreductase [Pirellulaceae bacterium]